MNSINRMFFASGNPGKAAEVSSILSSLSIDIAFPKDFPGFVSPEETGSTFMENARIKAWEGFLFSGIPTFAEDAGLEVEELGNEPGVFSSRYRGDVPQSEKNLDIIRRLDKKPHAHRRARFHSVILFFCGDRESPIEIATEGFCHGMISREARGTNGFGYDPIFCIPELSRTFGELAPDVKNMLSHRKNALEALKRRIAVLIEKGI